MLFNSLTFIVFTLLVFAIFPRLWRWRQLQLAFLVVASCIFYGWWKWSYLWLIAASGMIDYICALAIQRSQHQGRRRAFVIVSIAANLGILAAFKYSSFIAENLAGIGIQLHVPAAMTILPIGISFYTFQSMSYTIDVYRGRLEATPNLIRYFAYLSLFPQLVAGPIVRARDLLPQLAEPRKVGPDGFRAGLALIIGGYFKKLVFADNLAPYVDAAFAAGDLNPSAPYWWLIAAMFGVQIYADFSGYSDIARGLGRWLGLDYCENFDHPYRASSMREFWQRWHISLSTWFRDYVYIPLGGSQCGPFRAHLAMWGTMILSGLWHGAAWTFVCWGAYHAAVLSIERLTDLPRRLSAHPGGRVLAHLLCLALVLAGWVIFRAESMPQVAAIFATMITGDWTQLGEIARWPLIVLASFIIYEVACAFASRLPVEQRERIWFYAEPFVLAALAVGAIYLRGPGQQFIYFQF